MIPARQMRYVEIDITDVIKLKKLINHPISKTPFSVEIYNI